MRLLKYSVIGTNLWAVERDRNGQTVKIGEVVLAQDRTLRLIPAETYAFTHNELKDISCFMDSAPSLGLLIQEDPQTHIGKTPRAIEAFNRNIYREEELEIERLRR